MTDTVRRTDGRCRRALSIFSFYREGKRYRILECHIGGALCGVVIERPLHFIQLFFSAFEVISHTDLGDSQDAVHSINIAFHS